MAIRIENKNMVFEFPEVHPNARLTVEFQRTLRIPDDDAEYPLPPGLGAFPLKRVEDCGSRAPKDWRTRGGAVLPMYQSEALWINFNADYVSDRATEYPFAVKVSTGTINAISGSRGRKGLSRKPRQGYVVVPEQPWLDGYNVDEGVIRQFVAMPLGAGYTAEEQLTGRADVGGIQIEVYPMKREVFERRFPKVEAKRGLYMPQGAPCDVCFSSMGLAPGGRMRQEIYEDPYGYRDWDRQSRQSCWVHIANSLVWRQLTGENPPTVPPTAEEYNDRGLPWFEYYDDKNQALAGSNVLAGLESVAQIGKKKGDVPLPENVSVDPKIVIELNKEV